MIRAIPFASWVGLGNKHACTKLRKNPPKSQTDKITLLKENLDPEKFYSFRLVFPKGLFDKKRVLILEVNYDAATKDSTPKRIRVPLRATNRLHHGLNIPIGIVVVGVLLVVI